MPSGAADIQPEPTSFNGSLDRFAYAAPDSANTPATMKGSSTPRSARSLKRKLEEGESPISTSRRSPHTEPSRSQSSQPSSPSGLLSPSAGSPRGRRTPTLRQPKSTSASPINNSSKGPICNLRDTIPPNLILLLIGVNPGIMTGVTGHVYAHPSNLYWKLLYWSGITTHRHPPSDTYRLPELYAIGNTNIVSRPTKDASQLSKAEMEAGVPILEAKIATQRPEAVCIVGKSIWETVWKVKKGKKITKEEFKYGWQEEENNMGTVLPGDDGQDGWGGARVFVATTTSGLAAGMSISEKTEVWKELGRWVVQRREEKGMKPPPESVVGTSQ